MKLLKKIGKFLLVLGILFILCNVGMYIYCLITPKIQISRNQSYYMYDNKGEQIFNNYSWVDLDDISPYLIDATLSTEDRHFYYHIGFDYLRIGKAIIKNISSRSLAEGASTITQQYARNLYLNYEKTWKRKIDEAILAFELETHYSKDEILEGYLNTINYGGIFGIENASLYYFNKSAKDLTLAEAAMLAGIPQSPSNYSPLYNLELAKKRQNTVLTLMVNNEKISEQEKIDAYNTELSYVGNKGSNITSGLLYYKDAVLNELKDIPSIPDSLLTTGGIKIYTTLDSEAQKELEKSIDEKKMKDLQVAAILMKPDNGDVLALVGGTDYNSSQYNRAINAKRQVGSTMKPFLYYAALESGFTSASSFISEKTTFSFASSKTYTPKNYNDKYANGPLSMGAAIAYSDNIYALKTHLFLGEDNLSKMIERVKIKTPVKNNASAALGTTEINMLDYANGFITLANEGKHESPHLIERIEDANGNIIYEYKYENEYVLNKKYVYILNNLLTSTYNYSLVNYASPTLVSISNKLDSKYAVKSGSTATDYWTVGYNKDVLILVWAGNDDNSKVKSSESRITKYIWANTITNLDVNKKEWYDIPKGVTSSVIDPISGDVSAKGFVCYYEKGTEPNYVYNNIFDPN